MIEKKEVEYFFSYMFIYNIVSRNSHIEQLNSAKGTNKYVKKSNVI